MQPFVVHGMLAYLLSDGAESLGNEATRLPVARASLDLRISSYQSSNT